MVSLIFPDYAIYKLRVRRITEASVRNAVRYGTWQATWRGRRRYSWEQDGRVLVVVVEGETVVTAFRRKRQAKRR